ncbi:MAG: hypothetical protein ACREGC_00230 [Minisyncoccia bacterium]
MWEIIGKIWFFVVITPFLILGEGYTMFKNFLKKNNYTLDFLYVLLFILVVLFVALLLLGFR